VSVPTDGCATIYTAAETLVAAARDRKGYVSTEYRGVLLGAMPETKAAEVVAEFRRMGGGEP